MITRKLALALGLLTISSLGSTPAKEELPVSDKEMSVIDFEDIGYPPIARQTRTQGVVVVRVKLDGEGRVVESSAISGNELLVSACLANAKKWRFQPNPRRAAVIVYNFQIPPFAECSSKPIWSFSILQVPNFVTITGCASTVQP